MQLFQELGALVEHRWRNDNYDEAVFPGIAAEALREFDLVARTDPWEIIRWVHTTTSLPQQQQRKEIFGNPPITLFAGARFHVDVYYWLDGTTSIHQHAFSGAFQVLYGSSVHSHYSFEKEHQVNAHFLLGKIELQNVTFLGKGDVRTIQSGQEFIHSLFHLEQPSATIVIRSYLAARDAIQYNYLKPALAIDPFYEDDSLSKKTQTVFFLLRINHPAADSFIKDLLADADFQTTHAILDVAFRFLGGSELEKLFQLSKSSDRFQAMLECARQKHHAMVDLLPAVFEEQQRQAEIVNRRRMIQGEEHRLFLALLLNISERSAVLDLIEQRFPGSDPVELAVRWIRELASIRVFRSHEPNVLGLKEYHPSHLAIFTGLLRGLSDEELESTTSAELPSGASFDEAIAGIRASPLFKSIFRRAAAEPIPSA